MNFLMLTHLDPAPAIVDTMRLKPHAWTGIAERGEGAAWPERSLLLRGPARVTPETWADDLPCRDIPELDQHKALKRMIERVRRAVSEHQIRAGRNAVDTGAPLGRIMLSFLPPNTVTPWRKFEGAYHERHVRFTLALVTNPLVQILCGGESVHLPSGSLWWFNGAQVQHALANWGRDRRIHLTIDFRAPEKIEEGP